MAFQVPIPKPVRTLGLRSGAFDFANLGDAMQKMAAVTSDIWPSMSELLNAPWKNVERGPSPGSTTSQRSAGEASSTVCSESRMDSECPLTLLTAYSESRICRTARVPAHGAFGRFESGYYLPTGMVAFLVQW